MTLIADLDVEKYDIPSEWGYRAMIPGWTRHKMGLEGFVGWDKVKPTRKSTTHLVLSEVPPFVLVTLMMPKLEQLVMSNGVNPSASLALVFDRFCSGLFSYRNFSRGDLPGIVPGDTYWAGYWFEKLVDAKAFEARFGGLVNWRSGYDRIANELERMRLGGPAVWH